MLTPYVALDWSPVPCLNRCRHCYTCAGDQPITSVSCDRFKGLVEKFLGWANQFDEPGKHIIPAPGQSSEFPLPVLLDIIRMRREINNPGWNYINMNGIRFRSREELLELYSTLKDAGITLVNLSFHGYRQAHDAFAGRRGEFDYLLLMAEIIAELGLKRSETILLRKPTLDTLPHLLNILDPIPHLGQRISNMIDYLGRAIDIDHERLELDDLSSLPDSLRSRINTDHYRTESAWIETITRDGIPPKTSATYFIQVRDDNIDWLEQEDCEAILQNIREQDNTRRALEPPLHELARTYGDPSSQKLYRLRDLEVKWPLMFWRERDGKIYQQLAKMSDSWVRLS